MKTSLDHLPGEKRKELKLLCSYIKDIFDPLAIILFGSYARGDWVDIEGEYQSDFDIMVVCGPRQKKKIDIREELEKAIGIDDGIATKVSFNYEPLSIINTEIRKNNYLFIDIRREGVLLYSTVDFELEDVKDLEPDDRFDKAARDYKHWLDSSNTLFEIYNDDIKSKNPRRLNFAAFHLHQTTEHLFMATLLVWTGYKPKCHDLVELEKLVIPFCPDIYKIFPRKTTEEKHLYNLLRRAYVDARYDMSYTISIEELGELVNWINRFRDITTKICEEKLAELKKSAQVRFGS